MSSPPEQSHGEDEIVVCPRMASNDSHQVLLTLAHVLLGIHH